MSYYEDYFDEPSEFEQQIDEFKRSLADAVKTKIKSKIEALEKENEELREFRDTKEKYERIMRDKIREYDVAIAQAKRDAQMVNLKKLFGENLQSAYRPDMRHIQHKKCDRCDENRKIHYKTPTGREAEENCLCSRTLLQYFPKEVKLFSFYANSKPIKDVHPHLYYEPVSKDSDYDRYDLCGEIYDYDEKEFEKVNRYRVVFFDEAKCKEYCDWFNEIAREKDKEYREKWNLELEDES